MTDPEIAVGSAAGFALDPQMRRLAIFLAIVATMGHPSLCTLRPVFHHSRFLARVEVQSSSLFHERISMLVDIGKISEVTTSQ